MSHQEVLTLTEPGSSTLNPTLDALPTNNTASTGRAAYTSGMVILTSQRIIWFSQTLLVCGYLSRVANARKPHKPSK